MKVSVWVSVIAIAFVGVSCTTSSGVQSKPQATLDDGIYGELDEGITSPWLSNKATPPLAKGGRPTPYASKSPVKRPKSQHFKN